MKIEAQLIEIGAWRGELANILLALARESVCEGVAAIRPGAGVVFVWPHHVGEIWDGPNKRGRWLVHSGNDGNAVRTRWRSLFGVIAFRWVQ